MEFWGSNPVTPAKKPHLRAFLIILPKKIQTPHWLAGAQCASNQSPLVIPC
jgi:hypothetical protein